MKEEAVKKTGEDGITFEFVSASLLKAQVSIKSNFVTFVGAYAPRPKKGRKGRRPNTWQPSTAPKVQCPLGNMSLFFQTRTPGQGKEMRPEEKQTAKCWAHMAERSSTATATASYCWVSQKTTGSFF